MIKRKFGMRVLNMTQGRNNKNVKASHYLLNAYDFAGMDSGIDRFIAYYPYEIIGVLSYEKTGYANTVLFWDDENQITLALTHINRLISDIHYVGKKFNVGDTIYYEGTKGYATGNHIHVELGRGYQTSKRKDANGHYCLRNLIDIEDYFYVDDSIEVRNTQGITFERKDGVNKMSNNSNIKVIRIPRVADFDYKISVDGNRYGDRYSVTVPSGFKDKSLLSEGWEEVIATNGSIFYPYNGTYYAEGLEKSRGINNQDLMMNCVRKFENTMAVGFDYSGNIVFDIQKNIEKDLDKYYGAVTGAFGIMKNGQPDFSGYELEKDRAYIWSNISGRTIWGFDSRTDSYIVISIPGVTGKSGVRGEELFSIASKFGCTDAICFDGGGSRWLRNNGEYLVSTTSPVKNAIILYRKKKPTSIPPVEQKPEIPSDPNINDVTIRNEAIRAELIKIRASIDQILTKIEEN